MQAGDKVQVGNRLGIVEDFGTYATGEVSNVYVRLLKKDGSYGKRCKWFQAFEVSPAPVGKLHLFPRNLTD